MTERVRGPNRWDALNMAGMIIDAISTQRNFRTNEIEFKNQETLSLWTGLISRLVECENSYTLSLQYNVHGFERSLVEIFVKIRFNLFS